MMLDYIPEDIKPYIIPKIRSGQYYKCLGCSAEYSIDKLLYVCPECNQVLLIQDKNAKLLQKIPGKVWQKIFDFRKMLKIPALKGIYRYHEFIGPGIPLESIIYLGEGHTPVIEACENLKEIVGLSFFYKNDGQNPSASFKDRGMASAVSSIKYLIDKHLVSDVIAICASTGDTSAAAALYASYLGPSIKSAVLLPHKKVTPQQLSQPLGSGAQVFEIPGVFDDCMKIVEHLSTKYSVVLLNSKNAWRILGQESYSYEVAQDFDWDMKNKVLVVPIGNAGNISAIMNGFIKFYKANIIDCLPKVIGVQSEHADPVYQYYLEPDEAKRKFIPVDTKPSVAQAAMIGNPVSMPRVVEITKTYNSLAGCRQVFFVKVTEQSIMDSQLLANRNGHIACTQGGECLAGLVKALKKNIVTKKETAILDATAHAIKFSEFQDLYFNSKIPEDYKIDSDLSNINQPFLILPDDPTIIPSQKKRLGEIDFQKFIKDISGKIAKKLDLTTPL
ncbi:MAG: threonine synthase [Desulfobacula sp.]|jgi:threonine synthase|uniref:threonine synthase n=1 Tax=Desulfobacula sp. TaxID=2593537 RepID=UPI001E1998CB|nr:threonine synthase [Desulfobacula sp.]MBT3485087.1 threonine synthase [Desulfobacula sp.]MBT3804609.1 threonine synthase [Desulfobacula sp.]MBT4025098.1 threonine synthase [Desulfobacula sp.]MBT4198251.1 threonine synthase [Desulfobacula sp.]